MTSDENFVEAQLKSLIIQLIFLGVTLLIILAVELLKDKYKHERNQQLSNFSETGNKIPTLKSSSQTWSKGSSKQSGDFDELREQFMGQSRRKKSREYSRFSDS